MDSLLTFLYVVSPLIFFISLYYLFFSSKKHKKYKILLGVFSVNFLILIYLIVLSYKQSYISIYYGMIGIVGFVYAARGIFKYFSSESVTKEKKINVLIYIIICLIIGFGMCSTTGIFGF